MENQYGSTLAVTLEGSEFGTPITKTASISQLAVLFMIHAAASWCLMYFLPSKFVFTLIIPATFYSLFGFIVFSPLISGGWPFAPPFGNWRPESGFWKPGLLTTLLVCVLTVLGPILSVNVFPKIPLFPVGIWWGIILFAVTLWYGLTWNGWPLNQIASPAIRCFGGAAIIIIISVLLWTQVNLSGTPFAGKSYDPKGPLQAEWLFGCLVWIIAWMQIFSNAACFQQWPFYKMKKPWCELATTAVIITLGYFTWTISLRYLSPTFSSAAIAGSLIGVIYFHGAVFGLYPFGKYKQPLRGILCLALNLVCVCLWIPLVKLMMQPILLKVQALGLPFDSNVLAVMYTLHFVALTITAHLFFFLRAPLPPAGPPLPPEEII
ncbi:MAG: hypothetical protein HXX11_12735 [Desulfuromonadales bacterium]|nr:hypothetical protein [Desulfuromonadales bacterium]